MMKKGLLIVGLVVNVSGFAQTQPFIWNNDTIGKFTKKVYLVNETNSTTVYSLILNKPVSDSTFNVIKNTYPKFNVVYDPIQLKHIQLNHKTQDQYLIESGRLKNASVLVSTITTAITTILTIDSKYKEASVVSLIGGGISYTLNIAGNNALIKAGRRSH